MKRVYSLRIGHSEPRQVDRVLGTNCANDTTGWMLEVEETASDPPVDFVAELLSVLEGKYAKLETIGVRAGDVAVWLLYEYDQECNVEFRPEDLKKLGEKGIALCVSCWQK